MRRAARLSIAIAGPSLVALALAGCAVFDDDMRKGDDPGRVAADGRSGPGGDGDVVLASDPECTLDVPAGIGAGGCGGKGGELFLEGLRETEDNGRTPNRVVPGKPICGSLPAGDAADRFELALAAEECVELYLTGEGVTAVVEGPGANRLTLTGTSTVPLEVATGGTMTITFTGASTTNHYAFVVRK